MTDTALSRPHQTHPDPMRPERMFKGHLRAWGLFEDRFGNAKRRFVVDMHGTVAGDELTLVEDFTYDDGEEERRTWHLNHIGDGRYQGGREDTVGTAKGWMEDGSYRMEYKLAVPIGSNTVVLDFSDRFLAAEEGVVFSRATVRKFGIRLGEVFLVIRREAEAEPQAANDASEDAATITAAAE